MTPTLQVKVAPLLAGVVVPFVSTHDSYTLEESNPIEDKEVVVPFVSTHDSYRNDFDVILMHSVS